MTNHLWWYVARSGGIVAWALVAASVIWGLALSTKALGKRPRPNWILDLHRFLGGLALVFTGVHVGALVLDSYLYFGPVEIFVPLTSAYRPGAVAWGVVGFYLLLAVELTSLLRSRLPKKLWSQVHLASFPLFFLSTLHGLLAGSDSTSPVLRWAMLLATAAVIGLTTMRLLPPEEPPPNRIPRPAPSRTAVAPAGRARRVPVTSQLPPPPPPIRRPVRADARRPEARHRVR